MSHALAKRVPGGGASGRRVSSPSDSRTGTTVTYGMTALLVLCMVNELLLPGHVEHIAGFAGFQAAVESVVGPLSPQALASQIFGLCGGLGGACSACWRATDGIWKLAMRMSGI